MTRVIKMDGDLYKMVLPEDVDWVGIRENFPECSTFSFFCRRQNRYKVTLVNSSKTRGLRSQYLRSEKLVEYNVKEAEFFPDCEDLPLREGFRPCLVPLDSNGDICSEKLKNAFPNGTMVSGGTAWLGDIPLSTYDYVFLDERFRVGDSCLKKKDCILDWMWWDGKLICMSSVGTIQIKDLLKIVSIYDPELLDGKEKKNVGNTI